MTSTRTESARKRYVAGFLFDDSGGRVVLIEKQRPAEQKGLFNGVGGKVETAFGETPDAAMRREFTEETGVESPEWTHFTTLVGDSPEPPWRVYFYYAHSTKAVEEVRASRYQPTDERLFVFWMDELRREMQIGRVMANLRWLIPMALGMSEARRDCFKVESYVVREVRAE